MAETTLKRVVAIRVRKLFGLYEHVIKLNTEERVTIIHGINGVGKTVVLKLLAALFDGRYLEFLRVRFESFEVDLSNGDCVALRKNPGDEFTKQIQLTIVNSTGKKETYDIRGPDLKDSRSNLLVSYLSELPWLSLIGPDLFMDDQSGHAVSTSEALARYGSELPPALSEMIAPQREPQWFGKYRSEVNIHFIETQRLLRFGESRTKVRRGVNTPIPTVSDASIDLKGAISMALNRYARKSQQLEQSFPERLLRSGRSALTLEELKARMVQLEEKRNRLKQLGLLDESTSSFDIKTLDHIDDSQIRVLAEYVVDNEGKLDTLGELAAKIEILITNLNTKFRNKKLSVDRENGLVAKGHDGQPLDLSSLSSGEQHELVLVYDLLFRVAPGALVLIDEPELSLHVDWQRRFLDDLIAIVKVAKFDTIIATHSPYIVGTHNDLLVPLGEQPDQ